MSTSHHQEHRMDIEQPDLFTGRHTIRDRERERHDYPDGFWQWLEINEHIYRAFAQLALQARARGFPRWGAHAVLEHIRWQTALRDGFEHAVKVNNNARAGLSRLAMAEHDELAGFFSTREPPARREAFRIDGRPYTDNHAAGDGA
jgi:hypothetical protein